MFEVRSYSIHYKFILSNLPYPCSETHIGESSTVTSTIHPEQRGTRSDSFSVFKGVWEELKNPSFDPREKVIPLKAAYILGSLEVPQEQNTFCHESSNSASPGTSSISSLEASKVARSNNLEYQRTRVHNTRKVLSYDSL